jgi:hypothetical protein
MTARRGTTIASTAVAMTGAVAFATSGRAESADASKQAATPTATPTTSRSAARERPRGVVLDCHTQSGIGGGLRQFRSRWNLVVGPLVMSGAAARPAYFAGGGNKFPVYVRGGHRVTVDVSRDARPGAGLVYVPLPAKRDGYRVITFIACRRGEISRGSGTTAWPVSFWAGGVLARSPRCVPLRVWVDDEPSPRRAVIHLGVRNCG